MIRFSVESFSNPRWIEVLMERNVKIIGSINVISIMKIPLDLKSFKLLLQDKLNSNEFRFIKNMYGGM